MKSYTLLGWDISWFSGKVRSYLRHKRIPWRERPMSAIEFSFHAPRRTGAAAMPVLITPEGRWVQDSSVIIDFLESRFPQDGIIPATPVLRFVAYLLEIWGDEFWIPVGLHTRWSHRENYPRFEREAGANLLPHAPRFVQKRAAAWAAGKMQDHLRSVGIVPAQVALLDRWTEDMLDLLERHFAVCPWLLGERVSLADFGLIGPLYAHLGTDPWPQRELIACRPHVQAWIERMMNPPAAAGAFPEDDRVPETLLPVVAAALHEMLPWVQATLAEVQHFQAEHPGTRRIPRKLGTVEYPFGASRYRRDALPYVLWMVQRMQQVMRQLPAPQQAALREFLKDMDATQWLDIRLPHIERTGLSIAVAPG